MSEALGFWNEQLARAGAKLALGPITWSGRAVADDVLVRISDRVLTGGGGGAWPRELEGLEGEVVIVLSGADLVSVGFAPAGGQPGLIILRRGDTAPLSLPNVARNVIAHELGHALGLSHGDDPAMLMCGRPASCRPALFRSETPSFFPVTDAERGSLAERFP